jgi:hypothetical protein
MISIETAADRYRKSIGSAHGRHQAMLAAAENRHGDAVRKAPAPTSWPSWQPRRSSSTSG